MEEEKSIALDTESVEASVEEKTEAASAATETASTAESDTAEGGASPVEATPEEKKDVTEKLREAGDTINRASAEAESFKRRRDGAVTEGDDADKRREEEMKRIAEEEKKRESAAEEKRAALEYAESYRARIRNERESAAAKKKEEERARARAEEKAARERELKADIEREKAAARERSARAESLLERVSGDVSSANAKREASADDFFGESKSDLPIKIDETAEKTDTHTDAAHVTEPTATAATEPTTTEVSTSASEATTAAAAVAVATEAMPTPVTEEKPAEAAEDYVITVDGGHSERDLLYIEGTEACKIELGTPTAALASTESKSASTPSASDAASRPAPVAAERSAVTAPVEEKTAERTVEEKKSDGGVVPVATSMPYGDFTEPVTKPEEKAPKPVSDAEAKYEEEAELLRHSKEIEEAEKSEKNKEKSEIPTYPDPEPAPKKKAKKTKEERREERAALIAFERDSRKKKPFAEKERSDEEIAIEALEDEEAIRRDTAAAEVGDSGTKTESADTLEAKRVFDKKALEKNKARQIKNDNLLIEHRIYNDIRRLEMDTRTGEISFTAKIEDDKKRRARGKKKATLADTRKRLKEAVKCENADNARYYQLVLSDVDKIKLPKSTDREEVRTTRDELLALLKRRDELNLKLIELYSLSEGGKGKGAEGRFKAILNAKRAAYKKQLPSYKKYEKARISKEDKEKLYPLLDERTELYGELARVNYALKKEKAKGLAKKELKRERAKIMRQLDENKSAILHYERKALIRAEKETERSRAAIFGWIVLALVVVGIAAVIICWKWIQPWIDSTVVPWFSEFIGNLFGKIMNKGNTAQG